MPRPRGLPARVALLALVLGALLGPAGAITTVSLTFATGTFNKHPCITDNAQCDTERPVASLVSYYGKSRTVEFNVATDWTGGALDTNYCMCRLRANMYGFDDPFAGSVFNPSTDATSGITTAGGAVVDSKLEPWGTHWYRCWDQNSDVPNVNVPGSVPTLKVSGPSDAPWTNLPDGYYHFAASCTEDDGANYLHSDLYFKIDNVAPESSITPYVVALDSAIPGYTGTMPSYDPAAKDHRLRYKKTSITNPTNQVPVRMFDFKLSVVDYHGSANEDVAPYNPYEAEGLVTSKNIHGTMSDGNTFYAELETIKYECALDSGSWYACNNAAISNLYSSNGYGQWYFSETQLLTYKNVYLGNRFITTKQLTTGTHVLMVRATDLAGNTEMPTMYSFYVAPHTTGGFDAGCSFGHKLTSDNAAATYTDTDYDLSTSTSLTKTGLIDGHHTLKIFAKDEFGHETAEPGRQSVTWEVDRTAPQAEFTKSWTRRNTAKDSQYVANSGSASLTSAYFQWGFKNTTTLSVPIYSRYSIDSGAYTMDGMVSSTSGSSAGFTSISMPPMSHTFPQHTFKVGAHKFSVLGVDFVGNSGAPAEDSFVVEELDTVLNCDKCAICDWDPALGCYNCQDLSSAYVSDSITFDIHAMTDGESIKFKYDYVFSADRMSEDYKKGEHIPEFTVRNIGEGQYYVMARGRTLGGTRDNTPSCVRVTTDTTKPVVTINTDLKRINNLARMPTKVAGTMTDLNWRYDGITWNLLRSGSSLASAVSAKAVSGASAKMLVTAHPSDAHMAVWELDLTDLVNAHTMVEGQYALVIFATDKAGHKGLNLNYDWIIDLGPPTTEIVNYSPYITADQAVKITFGCQESGQDSVCSYKWRLHPAAAWKDADCNLDRYCTITVPTSVGVNTLEVKAVDLAGNMDAASDYCTWMVYDSATFAAYRALANFTTPFGSGPVKFDEPGMDVVQTKP